jgi:hypothetical protein
MLNHELKSHVNELPLLTSTVLANGTTNTNIIDTQGNKTTLLALQAFTLADAGLSVTTIVQHGDDSGLSDATTVANDDLVGERNSTTNAVDLDFDGTEDDTIKSVGYIGKKRYVRLQLTITGVSGTNTMSGFTVQQPSFNV